MGRQAVEVARKSWGWRLIMCVQENVLGGAGTKGTKNIAIKPAAVHTALSNGVGWGAHLCSYICMYTYMYIYWLGPGWVCLFLNIVNIY